MVGSKWSSAVLVVVAWTVLAWSHGAGQSSKDGAGLAEQHMTVHENGQSIRCKVLATWRLPDGNQAYKLQSLANGEYLTLVEEGQPSRLQGNAAQGRSKILPMRIFHWGQRKTPPTGVPVPPPGVLSSTIVAESKNAQPQLINPQISKLPGQPKESIIWWEEGVGSANRPQGIIPLNGTTPPKLPWETPPDQAKVPGGDIAPVAHTAPAGEKPTLIPIPNGLPGVKGTESTTVVPSPVSNPGSNPVVVTSSPGSMPIFPLLKTRPRYVTSSPVVQTTTEKVAAIPVIVPKCCDATSPKVPHRLLYVPHRQTTAGTGTILPTAGSSLTRVTGPTSDTIIVQSDPDLPATKVMGAKVGGGFGTRVGPLFPMFGSFGGKSHSLFAKNAAPSDLGPMGTSEHPMLIPVPGKAPTLVEAPKTTTPNGTKPGINVPALPITQGWPANPLQKATFANPDNTTGVKNAQGTFVTQGPAVIPTMPEKRTLAELTPAKAKSSSVFQRMLQSARNPFASKAASKESPALPPLVPAMAQPKATTSSPALQMAQGTPGLSPRTIYPTPGNPSGALPLSSQGKQASPPLFPVPGKNVGPTTTAQNNKPGLMIPSAPAKKDAKTPVEAAKPTTLPSPKNSLTPPAPAKESPGFFARWFGKSNTTQTAKALPAKSPNAPGTPVPNQVAQANSQGKTPAQKNTSPLQLTKGTPPSSKDSGVVPATSAPRGPTGTQFKSIQQAPPPVFPGSVNTQVAQGTKTNPDKNYSPTKPGYLPDPAKPSANSSTSSGKIPDLAKPPIFPGAQVAQKPSALPTKPGMLPDLKKPSTNPTTQVAQKPVTTPTKTGTTTPSTSSGKTPDLSRPPVFPGSQVAQKPSVTPTKPGMLPDLSKPSTTPTTQVAQKPSSIPTKPNALPDLSKAPLLPNSQVTQKTTGTPGKTVFGQNTPSTSTSNGKTPDLSRPPVFPGSQVAQGATNVQPKSISQAPAANTVVTGKYLPEQMPAKNSGVQTAQAISQNTTKKPTIQQVSGTEPKTPTTPAGLAAKTAAPATTAQASAKSPTPASGAIQTAAASQKTPAKKGLFPFLFNWSGSKQTQTAQGPTPPLPRSIQQTSDPKFGGSTSVVQVGSKEAVKTPFSTATQPQTLAQGTTKNPGKTPEMPKVLPDNITSPAPGINKTQTAQAAPAKSPAPGALGSLKIPGNAPPAAAPKSPEQGSKIAHLLPKTLFPRLGGQNASGTHTAQASKPGPFQVNSPAPKPGDFWTFGNASAKDLPPSFQRPAEPAPWNEKTIVATAQATPFPKVLPGTEIPSKPGTTQAPPSGPPNTSVTQNASQPPGRLPFSTASQGDTQGGLPSIARTVPPRTVAEIKPQTPPASLPESTQAGKEPVRPPVQAQATPKRDWRLMWGKSQQTTPPTPGQSGLEQVAANKTVNPLTNPSNIFNPPASIALNKPADPLLNPEKFNPAEKPMPKTAGSYGYPSKQEQPVQQTGHAGPAPAASVASATPAPVGPAPTTVAQANNYKTPTTPAPGQQPLPGNYPPGAQSALAARNGLMTPVTYVPVPVVTIPEPLRPPVPPQPKIPDAPQPAMYVNAFTPPGPANGSGQQGNPGMNGPMMNQRPPMANPAILAQAYAQNPFLANPALLQQGIQQFAQLPPAHQALIHQALFFQQQTYLLQQQALFLQQQQAMMQPQRPMVQYNYPANYQGPQAPSPFANNGQPNPAVAQVQYMPNMPNMGMNPAVHQVAKPSAAEAPHGQNMTIQQVIAVLIESPYPAQREWAANTLITYNWRNNPQILHVLLQAARQDPAPSVRAGCIYSLSRMNASTEPVMTTLQSLRNDPDPRVRHEVQQAYLRMGGPEQGNQ